MAALPYLVMMVGARDGSGLHHEEVADECGGSSVRPLAWNLQGPGGGKWSFWRRRMIGWDAMPGCAACRALSNHSRVSGLGSKTRMSNLVALAMAAVA